MFQAHVFKQAVQAEFEEDGPVYNVLLDFSDTMLEAMIARYSLYSAKGTTEAKFAHNSDQTMLSHLLNGLFPSLKLVYEGQKRNFFQLGQLDETALKVYMLAYITHDLDKIIHEALKTRSRAEVVQAQTKLVKELELIGADKFLPELNRWAALILWLAVNTQRLHDINLSQTSFIQEDFDPQTAGRLGKVESLLRNLCTFSDKIAFIVQSPEEIHGKFGTDSLDNLLSQMTNRSFGFVFHRLNEVRGFLSNLINQATIDYLMTLYDGDLIPYLYFPNGTVYLTTRLNNPPLLDWDTFNRQVREAIQEACQQAVSKGEGFGFSPLGLLKYPAYFHDFLSPTRFLKNVFATKTISDSRANVAENTLQKLGEMQQRGQIPATLGLDYEPDARVTMLGRFLINYTRLLEENLDAPAKTKLMEDLTAKFDPADWQAARQIPSPGGLDYRYYWLAGQYLKKHPLAPRESDSPGASLEELFEQWLNDFIEVAGPELETAPGLQGPYLRYLPGYLAQNVIFGLARPGQFVGSTPEPPDWAGQLAKYSAAKKPRESQLACTVCNGVFPSSVQEDAAVLFQPWVYKNRLPLYKGSNAGGICVICSLELMLRQILLGRRETGKKFEALELKYFFIYPAFFFTGLSGRLARQMIVSMDDIKVFGIRNALRNLEKISSNDILALPFFSMPEDEEGGALDIFQETEGEEKARGINYLINRVDEKSYPGFMFFPKRTYSSSSGMAATTASWIEAAWLGLALPLVIGARVVVSESYLPLFNSAAEFKETVVLDAPHQAVRYLLPSARLRLDELYGSMKERTVSNELSGSVGLAAFSRALELHMDTEAGKGDSHLGRFNRIARELATDKLWVFSFLQEQVRAEKLNAMPLNRAHHYVKIFEQLGGDMTRHRQIVDLYSKFYSPFSPTPGAKYPASRAFVQPVDIVANRIITDTLNLTEDEIKLEARQEVLNRLDRIRNGDATGTARHKKPSFTEIQEVKEFVDVFYKEIFLGYAEGQRSVLNSRLNRFKNGCEAAYSDMLWEKRQKRQQASDQVGEDLPDPDIDVVEGSVAEENTVEA